MAAPEIEVLDLLNEPAPSKSPQLGLGSIVLILGLVMVVAVVGVALTRQNQVQPASGPAPTFSLTTFEGQLFDLEAQRGKIVVLNFWGYWCEPCRAEAPLLQSIYDQYKERGVEVIGVTYIAPELDRTMAFLEEFGITYPNGDDLQSKMAEDYHITGAPETFIIDQNGDIANVFIGQITENIQGSMLTVEDLTGTLNCLLASNGEAAKTCIESFRLQ